MGSREGAWRDTKEVGGSLNGARKSIADVIRAMTITAVEKVFLGVNRKIVPCRSG